MREGLRVGACQTPEILGDTEASLRCVEDFAGEAHARDVDLLLFPECFLQGYLVDAAYLRTHAMDPRSADFDTILRRLSPIRPTIVLGFIEEHDGSWFNSAAVITRGRLAGVYRKTHLVPGESNFDTGSGYPTFEVNGVRFGINICYDMQFAEAAASVAAQGARLIAAPKQNMMLRQNAHVWKDRHNEIHRERVRETGLWLASSDVTGERGMDRIGLGPTCIIDPNGDIVAQVPLLTTGMAVADIS
ncbi:MAG TPA: carbon-nitrogen hydrolase family protein [Candidatus Limnocylindrales bacterium]